MGLSDAFQDILTQLSLARPSEPFGREHGLWGRFEAAVGLLRASPPIKSRVTLRVSWSAGKGRLSNIPFILLADERETKNAQRGVYCVYLFRQDASGVYLTFNQGVTKLIQENGRAAAYEILRNNIGRLRILDSNSLQSAGLIIDGRIDLHSSSRLARDYENSTVAYRLYERNRVPDDASLIRDLEATLQVYDEYLNSKQEIETPPAGAPPKLQRPFELSSAVEQVAEQVASAGFVFEPWHIATYVTALRTKPFVILAGVSGTGKSRLPALMATATGSRHHLIPVRPDWTDSADVLGYTDLQGRFRPGAVLAAAKEAAENPGRQNLCILDEMNLARVEQYFAEILSLIESRHRTEEGGYASDPILTQALPVEAEDWAQVGLAQNLAIVGTVNMDETTHGFSRKVLDRAFTLELSDVDLRDWRRANTTEPVTYAQEWPSNAWFPRASRLGELNGLTADEEGQVEQLIAVLTDINQILIPAQLQIGYRSRDEIALFVLHARDVSSSFISRAGEAVMPADLALYMKILPRIAGGSTPIRRAVVGLLTWSVTGRSSRDEEDANNILTEWESGGRPAEYPDASYPRCAGRLCLMWDRIVTEGYTSFWL